MGSNGRTQLHVFEGEVLCSQPKKEPVEHNDVIHVTADKAVEFNSPSGERNDIAFDKQQFERLMSVRHAAEVSSQKLLPTRLALWLAADASVMTDDKHRVVAWPDILYGDNRSGRRCHAKRRGRPSAACAAGN